MIEMVFHPLQREIATDATNLAAWLFDFIVSWQFLLHIAAHVAQEWLMVLDDFRNSITSIVEAGIALVTVDDFVIYLIFCAKTDLAVSFN